MVNLQRSLVASPVEGGVDFYLSKGYEMNSENGYIKSTTIWFSDLEDLVTPTAAQAIAAWDRLELPHEEHECDVTIRAWITKRRQVYYTLTLDYDCDTEVFVAEGYSIPVRSDDGVDWSEQAENGMWTEISSLVGEDAADRLTGIDLVRWVRVASR